MVINFSDLVEDGGCESLEKSWWCEGLVKDIPELAVLMVGRKFLGVSLDRGGDIVVDGRGQEYLGMRIRTMLWLAA
ncbi:hypothetical protein ACH5RR_023147 [Cinchona calisaya]|uniref:Uncharacterized protein n=1 Tax=Cinchona calisaya TaxID=153742 RepID=A0ABD2Z9T7_9GENT